MNLSEELCKDLLQINAIKLSAQKPFTWASGIKSPIYCDNRISLSFPEVRDRITQGFSQMSNLFGTPTLIAGVATAGIPHAAFLAKELNLPMIYVRSKAKGHGRENLIEGQIHDDAKILVIEDLFSTGSSTLKAVQALRDVGATVIGALAIFSYGLPEARSNFNKASCPFDTLTNYDILLQAALERNYINADEMETLKDWKKDPASWESPFITS